MSISDFPEEVRSIDPPRSDSGPSWGAELELWFERRRELTCLARRRHVGPLVVQRPFHPERDGTAHVYVLHPPGGLASGDSLEIACHVETEASVLITTPGATKFYRSAGGGGRQRTTIRVGRGGVCEHLPQETIAFDGADAFIETRVDLAPDATYLGWELVSLGRPAAGEAFANGCVRQRVEVVRSGRPIWYDRLALNGGSPLASEAFAFGGKPIFGVMTYAGPMIEGLAERIRAAAGPLAVRGIFAATQLQEVVACRYLGASMSEGKSLFLRAWEVLREFGLGKPAVRPRIWST